MAVAWRSVGPTGLRVHTSMLLSGIFCSLLSFSATTILLVFLYYLTVLLKFSKSQWRASCPETLRNTVCDNSSKQDTTVEFVNVLYCIWVLLVYSEQQPYLLLCQRIKGGEMKCWCTGQLCHQPLWRKQSRPWLRMLCGVCISFCNGKAPVSNNTHVSLLEEKKIKIRRGRLTWKISPVYSYFSFY